MGESTVSLCRGNLQKLSPEGSSAHFVPFVLINSEKDCAWSIFDPDFPIQTLLKKSRMKWLVSPIAKMLDNCELECNAKSEIAIKDSTKVPEIHGLPVQIVVAADDHTNAAMLRDRGHP